MYVVDTALMPINALEFALKNCNARVSEDGRNCVFSSEEELKLYEDYLRGVSWDKFRLEEPVYRMLCFLDLDHAWHYFCVFNSISRLPVDPYHGTDLVKTLLYGLYEYSVDGNKVDLRVMVLSIIFQHFNHPLGRPSQVDESTRARKALIDYLGYRPVAKAVEDHASYALYVQHVETANPTREARLLTDLNRAVVALPVPKGTAQNVYDRLHQELRTTTPSLTKESFLFNSIKELAQTRFETSWARAVVLPVWQNSVINWASQYAAAHCPKIDDEIIRSTFAQHQAQTNFKPSGHATT